MVVNVKRELQRLKKTGKISATISAEEIGRVLDLYNKGVDKRREKEYTKKIRDRNAYFYPLIKYAIKHGAQAEYKSDTVHFQSIKGGDNGK